MNYHSAMRREEKIILLDILLRRCIKIEIGMTEYRQNQANNRTRPISLLLIMIKYRFNMISTHAIVSRGSMFN